MPRARSRLCFGVPPMLLGIPGDNTYANYQEANRAFFRSTVLPTGEPHRRCAVAMAVAGVRRSVRLAVDSDRIEALSADRSALWERVTAAAFLTLNEKRIAAGYTPVEGGDGLGVTTIIASSSRCRTPRVRSARVSCSRARAG